MTHTKNRLEALESQHQVALTELKTYARWDEVAHDAYTEELVEAGFTKAELKDVAEETVGLKKLFG